MEKQGDQLIDKWQSGSWSWSWQKYVCVVWCGCSNGKECKQMLMVKS